MRKLVASFTLLVAFSLLTAAAWAAPDVEIKIKAEKEKIVTKDGQKVRKMVAAKSFTPGETIHYTILYRNKGNEAASNAVIDDPIPAGTIYIPDSATGEGADISFSIDGGKTYKKATLLFYELEKEPGKKERRVASPEQYTHVRWTVASIPPGGGGKVGFKVQVK